MCGSGLAYHLRSFVGAQIHKQENLADILGTLVHGSASMSLLADEIDDEVDANCFWHFL